MYHQTAYLKNILITISFTILLSACGGGSTSNQTSDAVVSGTSEQTTQPTETVFDTTLSGSVGDGPIRGSTVKIKNISGEVLKTITSDNQASYNVNIKVKGSDYPLVIEAAGGIDLVTGSAPDFTLYSTAAIPSIKRVNINPHSTMIVKTAERMPGGMTAENVETAKASTMRRLHFGLAAGLVPDPITTVITERNIAAMVKASEAFGEMIRRTRDRAGDNLSGDQVVQSLAADFSDGEINGAGATGTAARISTVSNIVSAQVLLESLTNDLNVNNTSAAGMMDDAIAATMPESSGLITTDDVAVTEEMITQTIDALNKSLEVENDPVVATIRDDLVQLSTAMPAGADSISTSSLTTYDSSVLDPSIDLASSGTTTSTITNSTPVISGSPASSVSEGSEYRFTPTASDADADTLSFSISNKPSWASFNSSTGTLSGTPGLDDAGSYSSVTIGVSDGTDSAYLPAFSITVNNLNNAPVISGTPATTVVAGSVYSFTPNAYDADGDSLTFNISNKPSWASFSTSTGKLSGTPDNSAAGVYYNIRIGVSDGTSSDYLPAFSITVDKLNTAPVISGTPATSVNAGSSYVFTPSASDADGDVLTFAIINKPSWASFDTSTGRLSGTPDAGDSGNYSDIRISVSDGTDTSYLSAFSIAVNVVNHVPTISGSPATTVVAGSSYSFTPSANDADGDSLSFSISNKPAWASFNSGNGQLTGTPPSSSIGQVTSNIVIRVSDGKATTSLAAFSIEVLGNGNGSVTLNWTPPTENTDGSVLKNLAGFRVYYGTSIGYYPNSVKITNPSISSYVVENLTTGTYHFVITAYTTSGVESGYSNRVSKTVQ